MHFNDKDEIITDQFIFENISEDIEHEIVDPAAAEVGHSNPIDTLAAFAINGINIINNKLIYPNIFFIAFLLLQYIYLFS